ncbi:bifunctional GNAT family N-acetyltransferase/hotdog fold thioesterase [Thalassotalea mangrovi]|uniref:GNAT family N-acetyltransferase n=1 Tax=Thalassotalea mangrovi TaxID=2572245 RepID=A0A4U1B409_9GAMM|nr:bifunctional GNAT family N-acetyltransferase/hotdog fold thioesterase [Thalassotalea mangrovi]TKB43997.1 GNAT family N-acetyltransferase [Thalassotalea mangrovi]
MELTLPEGYTLQQPQTPAQFAAYHHLRYQLLRKPWHQPPGSEIDELEAQGIHRMIVDANEQVVAVGRLHKSQQNQGQIRFMAVDAACQGMGLGRQLLQALEQQAIKNGISTICLNAREVALDFYLACGYQLLGEAHTLYGEVKHFSMCKVLTAPSHYQDTLATLGDVWHRTIPITQALKLVPCFYDGEEFVVSADRAANLNIHNTMFAGSIYSLATLTGWGWVYLQLQQRQLPGDIVLADANIRYHQPLQGYATAHTLTSENESDLSRFEAKGKARFNVTVKVFDGDRLCATFSGLFAVRRTENEK